MAPPTISLEQAALLVTKEGGAVPLRGVSVTGRVFGAHARIVLRQRYQNAEAKPVEAIYTFPVPSDAALVGFAMEAAGRRIEAEVKEREAAFRAYDDAVSKGHGAALLEQERPNVFTANVGNLLPGEETVIEVVYVQPLAADENALRLAIPTLVAPRYIPGAPAGDRTGHGAAEPTDRVPDADRISPRIGAVSYGLTIDVVFDLGRAVTIESPSHAVVVSSAGEQAVRVTLKQPDVPLDRDLVLLAAGAPGVAAGVTADRRAGSEGTFALTVVPDLFDPARRAAPRDVVFIVDVSGSMEGDSLREAKSALRLCLRHLSEGDRFQIISFSDSYYLFRPAPVPFTQATLEAADRWVTELATIGGTEMLEPLLAAADVLRGVRERDRIMVLLTDGQVGNEAEIVQKVVARAEGVRIYTFGIGTAVSDLLIRDLARRTRGAAELIHPGERLDEKVTAAFARATAARIEGVTLRWSGVDAGEIAPAEIGDLVDGEPWVVYGRYSEPGHGRAELRGKLRGEPFHLEVPVELPAEADREGLAALWATARIRDLEAASLEGRRAEANRERIVALSIEHHVASKHASFVLVEKRTGDRRAQGLPEARPIPVSAPAGWATFQPPLQEESVLFSASSITGAPAAMDSLGALADEGDSDFEGALMEKLARPMAKPAAPPPGFAPPPAPRAIAPAPARGAASSGFGPPPPPRGFGGQSHGFAPPPPGFAPPPPPPMAAAPMASQGSVAPAPEPLDPMAQLFAAQLASGLWEGADRSDAGRLEATARALEACLAAGIDSAHAVYGAQVKKAVEALCAITPTPSLAPQLALALAAAEKVASGRRLKAAVTAAIARLPR